MPLGINLTGYEGRGARDDTFRVGYFARVAPEKGLHLLAEAFRILRQTPGTPPCRLHVAGWLGENNRLYFEGIKRQLAEAGLADQFAHEEAPDPPPPPLDVNPAPPLVSLLVDSLDWAITDSFVWMAGRPGRR